MDLDLVLRVVASLFQATLAGLALFYILPRRGAHL